MPYTGLIAFFYKASTVILLSEPGWMSGLKNSEFALMQGPLISIHLLYPQLRFLPLHLGELEEGGQREGLSRRLVLWSRFMCRWEGSRDAPNMAPSEKTHTYTHTALSEAGEDVLKAFARWKNISN